MFVEATKTFTVGPYKTVAVRVGSVREVKVTNGCFWTTVDNHFCLFGECRIGDGWKEITAEEYREKSSR